MAEVQGPPVPIWSQAAPWLGTAIVSWVEPIPLTPQSTVGDTHSSGLHKLTEDTPGRLGRLIIPLISGFTAAALYILLMLVSLDTEQEKQCWLEMENDTYGHSGRH